MTFILTFVGLIVFAISCFTVGFRAGFKRLATFTITGLILDVIIAALAYGFIYATAL